MSTLNVSLPPAMKAFVAVQVHSGLYSSASDYMQTLIRADQHRRAEAVIAQQLRQDHTPKGAAQQAQPFLTKSQERAARKHRWLNAI